MAVNYGKDGDIVSSSNDTLGHFNNWELNIAADALEETSFGDGWDRKYVPGLRTATMTGSGYFEDDNTGQKNFYYQGMSTRTPAQVAVKLMHNATQGFEGNLVVTGLTIGVPIDGLQTFSVTGTFNGGVSTV